MSNSKFKNSSTSNATYGGTTCGRCKKGMRHNVPRLGSAGGFVHTHSGKLLCDDEDAILPKSQLFLTPQMIPVDVESWLRGIAKLWVVGKYVIGAAGLAWEFQGIFSTEELALTACRCQDCFIAPVDLNQDLGDESTDWPGLYYPHLESKPKE
jgi:hypothetical protein